MIKRIAHALVYTAAALGAVGTATAPAHAYTTVILYYTTYYSDDSYTVVVGWQKDKCSYGSDAGGSSSAYPVTEIWAQCIDGELYPYDG